MIKIIIFFTIIGLSIYYINSYYSESWWMSSLYSAPRLIAILVGSLALMFPRDYEKVPDLLYTAYKNT